jgi:sugar O-acyltransferase (sialic acid O-acetyltransferase NeuD family)
MKDIVLIGAGGHAASCIDVIEAQGGFRIVGLVGLEHELHQRYCGHEVIATDKDLRRLASEYGNALITVGQIQSPFTRISLFQKAREAGFSLPAVVSPCAHVSRHAQVGGGSIVMHGVVINANARIGGNCIINTRAVIEHDVEVGDHCHISTGAVLNGGVHVGMSGFVGSGTVIKQGISIGSACLVGMGSVLRHPLPDGAVFWTGRLA